MKKIFNTCMAFFLIQLSSGASAFSSDNVFAVAMNDVVYQYNYEAAHLYKPSDKKAHKIRKHLAPRNPFQPLHVKKKPQVSRKTMS